MYAKYFKRLLDFLLSFIVIIILSPALLVIAIAIKIDSKGPVFFLQERLGKDGKVFKIIKFRTMVKDAEHMGTGIKTTEKDSRITKVGSFLRKTSLDEIPQLINVLKGDMSIVGPRPPVTYHPHKYEEYSDEQKKRFNVRPGITGLAQVRVRNSASWDDRIKIDVEYVSKITMYNDIKIIIKTVVKIFKKENIYNNGENMNNNDEITIRKFNENDIENKVKWINNPENNKYLHYDLPLEYNKTLQWYKNNINNKNRYDAIIEYNGNSVGIIGLLNIDYKNKKAEYYITMGENAYKGKGIAYRASKQIIEYAFKELGLNKVYLYTEVENLIAQKLFDKLGMVKEGLLKEDLIINGKKKDRYTYAIFNG